MGHVHPFCATTAQMASGRPQRQLELTEGIGLSQ